MVATAITVSVVFIAILTLALIKRSTLESFLYYVAGYFLGGDINASIAPETLVEPDVVRTVDGDLVTYLRVRGARRLIGPDDFTEMSTRLSNHLRMMLSDGSGNQHAVSVGYLSDPTGTGYLIRNLLQGAVATAQRMGAVRNTRFWFDERAKFLSKVCNDEVVVFAIYTLRSGLTAREAQDYRQWMEGLRDGARKKGGKNFRAARGQNMRFNQSIHPVYPVMASRHRAMVENFINSVENAAGGIGIILDVLEGGAAMYSLRRFIDGTRIPPNWRPSMFGDKAPTGSQLQRSDDLAHVQPIPIGRQLITEPTIERFKGFEMVQREGLLYASLKMDVCPHEEPVPGFSDLVDRVGSAFPYSLSVEISPNGLEHKKTEQLFVGFFGGFGAHNKSLRGAWEALRKLSETGEYIATLRLVCTTWAKDEDTLGDQLATLKMALQSWGGSVVSNESGAPSNLLLSTAPTLSRYNPAPFLPGPLSTFARMLPVFRAASPWESGQLILRSSQGAPYPIEFGSTNQAFWGTLVFAPPGRGKSFLMNCLNAGLLFSPGITDLPYITIIDKGMSSANVIELARALLPPDRRHQAISIRLRNTVDYAINVLDTQLGLDYPTERERDFQINIISALCPNLGPEGVNFIGQVIDEAYRMLSRDSTQAKRWQRSLDVEASVLLEQMGYEVDGENTARIWDVVDALFDAGDTQAAIRAQRYAVPVLDDLVTASHAETVQSMYSNTPTPTGEKITDVFVRSITTASREYALISTHTRFDIGGARVVSVDLEEVLASTSSEEARRRASVMMLFARHLGARNYFLKWSEIENLVPKRYRDYQQSRIKVIFETLKFLEYDEFHNAHGMNDVLRMVEQDFREGRKYNVVPLLSSQLFQDFTPDLIETATNFFVLGVGTAEASKKIQDKFELTEAERRSIFYDCLGPGPKGAPLFAMFKTDRGTVSQLLYNSVSSIEVWAFNSSALDVAVRQAVQEELDGDYWLALKGLGVVFPSGTARHEIARVRQAMGQEESADESGIAVMVARQAVNKIRELNLDR